MAYELIKDFQYTNEDNKILTLSQGTMLDQEVGDYYVFKIKNRDYKLEKNIVENNPAFFKKRTVDTLLAELIKKNKKRTAPKLTEMIMEDIIDGEILKGRELITPESIEIVVKACFLQFKASSKEEYMIPIHELGYGIDADGLFKYSDR